MTKPKKVKKEKKITKFTPDTKITVNHIIDINVVWPISGWAISKKIVEDHNGQIELLDSELLGGAMVRIKLFIKIK